MLHTGGGTKSTGDQILLSLTSYICYVISYLLYIYYIFLQEIRSVNLDTISREVSKLQCAGNNITDSYYRDDSFWGMLCTSLSVPNQKNNRRKLQIIHSKHIQVSVFFCQVTHQMLWLWKSSCSTVCIQKNYLKFERAWLLNKKNFL